MTIPLYTHTSFRPPDFRKTPDKNVLIESQFLERNAQPVALARDIMHQTLEFIPNHRAAPSAAYHQWESSALPPASVCWENDLIYCRVPWSNPAFWRSLGYQPWTSNIKHLAVQLDEFDLRFWGNTRNRSQLLPRLVDKLRPFTALAHLYLIVLPRPGWADEWRARTRHVHGYILFDIEGPADLLVGLPEISSLMGTIMLCRDALGNLGRRRVLRTAVNVGV